MWDVVNEAREYIECTTCGFKGIGWVQYVANDNGGETASIGVCDICEHAHDLNEDGV